MIWAPSVVRLCFHPSVRDLSVRMNISHTNEYFFPILYTCIYSNPPMNPVKFCPDKILNGWLIVIFVCWNWQNIWKCLSGWISPTLMNISSWYSTHAFTTILNESCEVSSGSNSKWPTYRHFCLLKLTKYLKKKFHPDKYLKHQWIFVSDNLHMR